MKLRDYQEKSVEGPFAVWREARRDRWHNASRREPCPVCHKPDWCTMSNDGVMCVCRRVESARPTASGSGWIHVLKQTENRKSNPMFSVRRRTAAAPDMGARLAALHAGFDGDRDFITEMIWAELGLMDDTLAGKLDIRYDHGHEVMSFPMRNARGEITGLRYRHLGDGRKWSARGSKDGLFIPTSPPESSELVICEGPSDTCAALSLGMNAIGRSSCMSGQPVILEYIRLHGVRRLVIMADGDAPGYDGARRLAKALPVPSRIILPPPGIKDLREWSARGKGCGCRRGDGWKTKGLGMVNECS